MLLLLYCCCYAAAMLLLLLPHLSCASRACTRALRTVLSRMLCRGERDRGRGAGWRRKKEEKEEEGGHSPA